MATLRSLEGFSRTHFTHMVVVPRNGLACLRGMEEGV